MQLIVSSPCPMKWEDLTGNDRIRFCGKCRLHVYNLAIMSREEVATIVGSTRGRLCGRLYVRGDRTATSRNCPEQRRRQIFRRIVAVAGVLLLGAFGWIFRNGEEPDRKIFPPLIKKGLDFIDPQPKPQKVVYVELGWVSRPYVPPPAPPPPAANEAPTPSR
jgi:hypothetical protein